MNRVFDLIKETLKGKSLYRVLFNWRVAEYCVDLDGVCVDLACGKKPASYWRYWKIKPERLVRIDSNLETEADMIVDLNNSIPLADNLADNIFMFNALYLIKEPLSLLKEIRRILKPGGRAFITFQFIKSEERHVADWHRFTARSAEAILNEAGFTSTRLYPVGERFSAIGNLADFAIGTFFISNLLKVVFRPFCLLGDKLLPKKIKENYPCPIAWFAVVEK